jgi:hypothetical protein
MFSPCSKPRIKLKSRVAFDLKFFGLAHAATVAECSSANKWQ